MSITPAAPAGPPVVRRVRQQAREVAAVMAFSAATSVGVATCLLLLTSLAR
jgi:hypothetical protein